MLRFHEWKVILSLNLERAGAGLASPQPLASKGFSNPAFDENLTEALRKHNLASLYFMRQRLWNFSHMKMKYDTLERRKKCPIR
jgi:hypothetical protein